jgi:WD40 repeat protein
MSKGRIKSWPAPSGVWQGHTSSVRSVVYSPDGRNVVSGSGDNTIRIWDAQTGAAVGEPLKGHNKSVSSVTYSPDGQNVVSSSADNTIRIWETQTNVEEGELSIPHNYVFD